MRNINGFVNELFKDELGVNSLVIMKNENIITEQYRVPYKAGMLYDWFSTTKMITAVLACIAADKGYIDLNDPVVSFFPDKMPDNPSDNLKSMTVHHLISMQPGRTELDFYKIAPHKDWVKAFLALPVPCKPGSVYKYTSHGCHVTSAIIQRSSGMSLLEFAKQYLFAPLGINHCQWETADDGVVIGGMGLALSTSDMAKIGSMLANDGFYNGNKILSKEYIKRASTNYILDNDFNRKECPGTKYGYTMHLYKGCFYHPGAFGQMLFVIPAQNTSIAFNSRIKNYKEIVPIIDKYFLSGDSITAEDEQPGVPSTLIPETMFIPRWAHNLQCVIPLRNKPNNLTSLNLSSIGTQLQLIEIFDDTETIISYDYNGPSESNLLFVKDQTLVNQPVVLSATWESEKKLVLQNIYTETPYITKYEFVFSDHGAIMELSYSQKPTLGKLSAVTRESFTVEF